MGVSISKLISGNLPRSPANDTFITGLSVAWPDVLIDADHLRNFASRYYPTEPLWLKKLLHINQQSGIATKAIVDFRDDPSHLDNELPSAEQLDKAYRRYATPLAAEAARGALKESRVHYSAITHIVAVTATNAGSPGLDQLVANELGLSPKTERVLLSGAGCSGGLAAVRVASDLSMAASCRGLPARILVVACEICSIQLRAELHAMSQSEEVGVGPVLFSDGAAALVICNSQAMTGESPRQFGIVRRLAQVIPETIDEMSYRVATHGFLLRLSKNVPKFVAAAVRQPFDELCRMCGMKSLNPIDFDWALHPGGLAIIKGVQVSLELPESILKSTNHIYRTRGNTSSVAVLAVLDHLRTLDTGKKHVVAASFGPGLAVEMAMLQRL